MAYNSHDPRKLIRDTIGSYWWTHEEGTCTVVTVTDKNHDTVRIPLRMAEEFKAESLDEFPAIEMVLVNTSYEPHDIAAGTRKREAYIDFNLYFTDTDNIDRTKFGKDVMDKLQDLIRSNHCTFGNSINRMFVNIEDVRYIEEPQAHQVIYHYVCTIYAIHYDCCED